MKMSRLFPILAIIIVAIISAAPGLTQTKVQPIDIEGIQKMIAAEDCHLFLVAIAAWCGPCREELPILNKLYTKYKEKGLKLVAVSLDANGPDAMQRVADKLELKFPVYWGGDRMAFEYNIFGVPTILVVREGKIQERIIGKRDDKYLEDKISSIMRECAP
jgi:thiol-disulfide isomerase/thioredoxin